MKFGVQAGASCAAMAVCAILLSSGPASAAAPLSFSYAATGVGYCAAGVCSGSSIIYTDQDDQFGYRQNNATNSSDPMWGSAGASAAPAVGGVPLPALHSDTEAVVSHTPIGFSRVYSFAQGTDLLRWTGPSIDLAVSDFVGSLSMTNTGGSFGTSGFGEASASLAILTSAVGNNALGNTWFADDGTGGFLADCSTAGAIAVGETNAITTIGSVSRTVTASCPASATFHLNTGDSFNIWARVFTFRENGGDTDADFTVGLSSALDPATRSFIASHLIQAGVPEPSIWATMIVGFAAAGAALRRRRTASAA
jgi:hypothetical protein